MANIEGRDRRRRRNRSGRAGSTPGRGTGANVSPAAGTLRLSDDLFVVSIPGEANVVAQTGADGVLLVDGGSAAASDALMKAVAGLPGGGPVHTHLQHALAPRADRLERAARQGRRDDHRAREHAAVADDGRHLAVERAALQAPAEDRATEQDLLRRPARSTPAFATATSRTPRTPTAICTCTSRSRTCSRWATRSRARAGRSSTGRPAAGLAASSAACSGCRRWPTRRRASCRRADRCSAWQTSRRSPRCTARSTIA